MSLSYLSLVIVAALSVRASASIHRYLGFGTMAAGAVAVNYFLMEPVHSFRVSQIGDMLALGCCGFVGMFAAIYQTASVRRAATLVLPRFQSKHRSLWENAELLDVYHFELLVQLCAEIARMRGFPVDRRVILNIALRRLEADSEASSREILEDIRCQVAYEEWSASHLQATR